MQSQVGRRLFLSFLVAALLPMAGLAWHAYRTVEDTLIDVNERRLRQDSKALGMRIIQELNWRSEILRRHAGQAARGSGQPGDRAEGFAAIAAWHGALSAEESHHLAQGRALLRIGQGGSVTLLVREGEGEVIWQGRLRDGALWRNDEAPEHYCLLASDMRMYFCTPGLTPPAMRDWQPLGAQGNTGTFVWRVGGQEYLGGYWRARMNAAYDHPGMLALVAEPKAELLGGLHGFRQVFIAASILASALALLLALNRIRRQMRPLDRLTESTRRLASGDFSVDTEVETDDEFGRLGHAFNRMASTLRYKFHMLRMLGDLDRAILAASEMDHVVRLVLRHIVAAIPCDRAGIVRLDAGGDGTLFIADGGRPGTQAPRADCRDAAQIAPDTPTQSWRLLEWDAQPPACLSPIAAGMRQAMVFPVRVNQRLDSVLVLLHANPPEERDEIVEAGLGLTQRLAVAASNIAWEERLYRQAHYDALTDLPNRVLLRDRVEQALMRADREHSAVAVLLIDLDNFKQVNDSLGHSAGDAFLVVCAQRLSAAIRQSDTAARLGGDEFVLLIPDIPRGTEDTVLDEIARDVNRLLAEPARVGDRLVATPASIGIALYPDNATGFEELLKMADAAMYESKRRQQGGYRFYSGAMNAEVHARFELTQDLRAGMANDELTLHYQPKVSTTTGRIVAAEALVRWNSPKRGLVPPGQFVDMLDTIGLGSWLGEWVLDHACAQMAAWDDAGLPSISVSVNISPTQFQESDIVEKVVAALRRHGLDAPRLELEILEATAANESPEIQSALSRMRALGIGIALDDFGTGYSSLVYLTQLPANILKLDRAFTHNLMTDTRQQAIVERIIALARALDLKVVAEGVEDAQQMTMLSVMGCHMIQGYLTGRPVPPEDFAERLRSNGPRPDQPFSLT